MCKIPLRLTLESLAGESQDTVSEGFPLDGSVRSLHDRSETVKTCLMGHGDDMDNAGSIEETELCKKDDMASSSSWKRSARVDRA